MKGGEGVEVRRVQEGRGRVGVIGAGGDREEGVGVTWSEWVLMVSGARVRGLCFCHETIGRGGRG